MAGLSRFSRRCGSFLPGDSITQGCLAIYPSRTYVNQVAEALPMDTINQGVAGCTHIAAHLDGIETIPVPDLITLLTAPMTGFRHVRRRYPAEYPQYLQAPESGISERANGRHLAHLAGRHGRNAPMRRLRRYS
jgi:hypothetical protein